MKKSSVVVSANRKELRIPKGAEYQVKHVGDEIVISYEEKPEITPQDVQDAAFAGRLLKTLIKFITPFLKELEEEARKEVDGYRK